jgi:hypothetical protein
MSKLSEKDIDIIAKDFTTEQIKSLYYCSDMPKKDAQKILVKMIELGKEYRGGLISDKDGNAYLVHFKKGKNCTHKLDGFKFVEVNRGRK